MPKKKIMAENIMINTKSLDGSTSKPYTLNEYLGRLSYAVYTHKQGLDALAKAVDDLAKIVSQLTCLKPITNSDTNTKLINNNNSSDGVNN